MKIISSKGKIKNDNNCGFTLVELIVVITILAILGSIAFISLKGYALNARDGTRITDMRNISKSLVLFFTKTGRYPHPENVSTITASGTTIRYQGYAGNMVLSTIGIGNVSQGSAKNPLSGEYYSYIIDGNNTQHSIIGYFESGDSFSFNSIIPKVNASFTGGLIKTLGANLGLLIDKATSLPVHEQFPEGTTIDIRNSPSEYKVRFNLSDVVEGTGLTIYTAYYNRDRYLLTDKELAKLDPSLVGYWDMESTVMSGTLSVMKDFSKNGNNGICHDGGTVVNCGQGRGPQLSQGKMFFDGVNDYIEVKKNIYSNNMTILVKVRPVILDDKRHGILGYEAGEDNLRPFNLRLAPNKITLNGGFHYDSQEASATSLANATSTGKRCQDIKSYVYDKDADPNKDIEFYLAYRRNPPYVSLDVNGSPFVRRDCRVRSATDPARPQVTTFNNFHTNFNIFWIGRVDNYFKGTIDEVRVYNRTLTDDEISSIYASTNNQQSISVN